MVVTLLRATVPLPGGRSATVIGLLAHLWKRGDDEDRQAVVRMIEEELAKRR
jgi:hypothetical protein